MSRSLARASRIAIDLVVLALAYVIAFFVRFDGLPPADHLAALFFTVPYVVALEFLVLRQLGIHRFVWRYIGLREIVSILVACLVCAGVLAGWRAVVGVVGEGHLRRTIIPYGVVAANLGLEFLGIAGVRVLRRLLGERRETVLRRNSGEASRTLLVGAGQAGVLIARELGQRPDLRLKPVGFLDDDPNKLGMVIHGIPVVGTTGDLPEMCARLKAAQVLIAMANAPAQTVRSISQLAERAGIPAKIIPGLYEIVGGTVNLSRIRNVAIEDLLGREPVALDLQSIAAQVENKVVMVTGAGGSIGSELCRQLLGFRPAALVLVERAENNLFHIHRELLALAPAAVKLHPRIADITDADRIRELFEQHRPFLVLHAAAHKHVPMMEWNPREAVKNNVLGTRLVADLAHEFEADAFVMISTDKAVNPTSVMGASKRAAEVYVQALSERSRTRFVTVRFGNVLGSAGSVIPIFQEQIARGGPVTVTHPEMRRYFMTIPEACQLVLQAGSMGHGGEIFILDMGEPVRIVDLARDLITLSGLRAGEDIEIEFSGVRPGEKLFEELSTDSEQADGTLHPKIFVGRIARRAFQDVLSELGRVQELLSEGRAVGGRELLRGLVPEFHSPPEPSSYRVEQPEVASTEADSMPSSLELGASLASKGTA